MSAKRPIPRRFPFRPAHFLVALALALALPAHADSVTSSAGAWGVFRSDNTTAPTACYVAYLANPQIVVNHGTLLVPIPADTRLIQISPLGVERMPTASEKSQQALVIAGPDFMRLMTGTRLQIMTTNLSVPPHNMEISLDPGGLLALQAQMMKCTASPPLPPPATAQKPPPTSPTPQPTTPATPPYAPPPAYIPPPLPVPPATVNKPTTPGTVPATPNTGPPTPSSAPIAQPVATAVGTQCSATLVARLKALPLTDAVIAQVCK